MPWRYFKVKAESAIMCGFDSVGVFKAKSEEDLYDTKEFLDFEEEMRDYVWGWVDDELREEYGEEAEEIRYSVKETTKEIYDEEGNWNSF